MHRLHHAYIQEGQEWPEGIPKTLGPHGGTFLVHVSNRDKGTALDIWWTQMYEDDELDD